MHIPYRITQDENGRTWILPTAEGQAMMDELEKNEASPPQVEKHRGPYVITATGGKKAKARKWNPVPNPSPAFTEQQNFAYRLRELMGSMFMAGVRYGRSNPAADGYAFVRADELDHIPEHVAFRAKAGASAGAIQFAFGLSDDVVAAYFAP